MSRQAKPVFPPVPGGFRVQLPERRGSIRRVTWTAPTRAAARAYWDAGQAALDAGEPLPDPAAFTTPAPAEASTPRVPLVTPASAPAAANAGVPQAGTDFASVAADWVAEWFGRLRLGQPERRRRVEASIRTHLVPFMARNGYVTGSDVQRSVYVDFLVSLASAPTMNTLTTLPGNTDLTIEQAAAYVGVSVSTIKRRLRTGELTGARLVNGRRVIAVASLPGAGLGHGPLRRGPRSADGYSGGELSNIRHAFERILIHGRDTAGWVVQFDPKAIPSPTTKKPAPRGQLSVADCAAMAAFLHPVHQVTLWLLRALGLRISEAFGLRVNAIYPQGDRALIRVSQQGGKNFIVTAADGRESPAQIKARMKSLQSARVLLAPRQLVALVATTIAVFHTSPDGTRRQDARLIPGLMTEDVGGQEAFREALRQAAREAGITLSTDDAEMDEQFVPTPKDARAGVRTDLGWSTVEPIVRHRWGGHAAGNAVAERHYVLDHPEVAKLLPATEEIERLIDAACPDGLMTPTTKSCTTANQQALHADRERLDALFLDLGWVTTGVDADGAPVLTAEQAADVLGVSARTVRRWAREGMIPGIAPSAGHLYPAEAIVALGNTRSAYPRLTDTTVALGVDYHRAWQWIREQGLPVVQEGTGTAILLPPDTCAALVGWAAHRSALASRAMTVTEAAACLSTTGAVVEALIRAGTLDVDPDRGDQGRRYVTRASLTRYLEGWPGSPSPTPPDSNP